MNIGISRRNKRAPYSNPLMRKPIKCKRSLCDAIVASYTQTPPVQIKNNTENLQAYPDTPVGRPRVLTAHSAVNTSNNPHPQHHKSLRTFNPDDHNTTHYHLGKKTKRRRNTQPHDHRPHSHANSVLSTSRRTRQRETWSPSSNPSTTRSSSFPVRIVAEQ